MEVLPAGGVWTGSPEPEFRRDGETRLEDAREEAVPAVFSAPPLRGMAERLRGSRDSWEGEEDPELGEPRDGHRSRTASLVSGLLTELYSCTEEEEAASGSRAPGGRRRRRDVLDSSTEASDSDVFLGGRSGAGSSHVLQELQERPSQRHQMQYLQQKDVNELKTVLRELKYRIGIQSAKLLRQLKQKDRLLHKVQKNCDIVTACLQAVSQKRTWQNSMFRSRAKGRNLCLSQSSCSPCRLPDSSAPGSTARRRRCRELPELGRWVLGPPRLRTAHGARRCRIRRERRLLSRVLAGSLPPSLRPKHSAASAVQAPHCRCPPASLRSVAPAVPRRSPGPRAPTAHSRCSQGPLRGADAPSSASIAATRLGSWDEADVAAPEPGRSRMRQDKLTGSLRRGGRCLKRQGGVGTILSNVLKKRSCISRTAPRLLCTLEPGVDTKLKFTLEPSLGQNGFQQWYDALKAVARLSTGIPKEWRRKVWLTLADHYLHSIAIDWDKTMRFTFNERSNPDDDSMGIQIVKDLHRTGCSSYCGQEAEQDRVVLKRVLLAYARWNKNVGYCQGFNILAALILEVMEGNEGDALKIMIYLIDKVLPESYFVNNLRALSVDMAVFRDLLRMKLPELSQHLDILQRTANKESGGGYEPPLTNVFTMQWFLTLFATCLPNHTVLKIWDSVFFEGSEIILRVSLAIWAKLGEQIECCETADEFYSTMGRLTQEMLENDLLQSHELMQTVYSMAPFPFPQLAELREKYTYNITPFPATVKPTSVSGRHGKVRDSDEENDPDDEDAIANAVGCLGLFSGLLAPELQRYQKQIKEPDEEQSLRSNNIAELSPGAINSCRSEYHAAFNSMMMERMTTDINALKQQYSRIKKKQQQQVHQVYIRADKGPVTSILPSQVNNSPVINHLLLGKKMKMTNRAAKNAVIHIPGHSGGKISPVPFEDLKSKLNSPWRTHIRVHKKTMPRTKSHPGCGDTIGLIEEQSQGCKASTLGAAEEFASGCAAPAQGEGGPGRTIEGQSPEPVFGEADVDVSAVQVKLEALELNQREAAAETVPTVPPPCPRHFPDLPDAPGENKTTSKPLQGSTSKTPIFSPFPSVKPLRKSATARNLGLYGPTERTPTLHFPQMSRSFSKPGSGNSGSKKR